MSHSKERRFAALISSWKHVAIYCSTAAYNTTKHLMWYCTSIDRKEAENGSNIELELDGVGNSPSERPLIRVVPHGGNLSTLCHSALKRKYGTRVGIEWLANH